MCRSTLPLLLVALYGDSVPQAPSSHAADRSQASFLVPHESMFLALTDILLHTS